MPSLQLRSLMPSAWWLLVLPVRRGGMTESMTAASHWPVFTATGGFVMSLMFKLAVNGFHQPHRRCTQVPAALPLTGNIASGWRQPSGRVGQLPAGRKPQMGAGHDASRLPAAHPRHEPLHRKARPMSQQLTVPTADTQLHIVDTPTASQ